MAFRCMIGMMFTLDHDPDRRCSEQETNRVACRQARDEPASQRIVKTHDHDQCEHDEDRDPERRFAEYVDRGVEPVGTREEQSGAIPETEMRRALCRQSQAREKKRQQQNRRHGIPADGRKGQHRQGAA